jgi:hypothetical protein
MNSNENVLTHYHFEWLDFACTLSINFPNQSDSKASNQVFHVRVAQIPVTNADKNGGIFRMLYFAAEHSNRVIAAKFTIFMHKIWELRSLHYINLLPVEGKTLGESMKQLRTINFFFSPILTNESSLHWT